MKESKKKRIIKRGFVQNLKGKKTRKKKKNESKKVVI